MKKKLSVFTCFAASLLLVFLLAACGNKTETDSVPQVIPTEGIWSGSLSADDMARTNQKDIYVKFTVVNGQVAAIADTADAEGNKVKSELRNPKKDGVTTPDYPCSVVFNSVVTSYKDAKDENGNVVKVPDTDVPVFSAASFKIYDDNYFKFDSDSNQSYDVEFGGTFTSPTVCTGYIKIKVKDGIEYSYSWTAMPKVK